MVEVIRQIWSYCEIMDRLEDALRVIDRANFLPEDVRSQAIYDVALPIGFGQTNSQPATVKMMLEWLAPEQGDKVLDVGSGSGWTSALLAYMVSPSGEVYGVEAIPELMRFGKENCRRAGIYNVHLYTASKELGLPLLAPFDRILVSASTNEVPPELFNQLKVGGKMVIPIGEDVLEIEKLAFGNRDVTVHRGFAFVPLVHQ